TSEHKTADEETPGPKMRGVIARTTVEGCNASAAPAAVTTVAALEAMGLSISDACTSDAALVVTSADVPSGSCPLVITRTYTVKEIGSARSRAVEKIRVQDVREQRI